ncbi:TonB-dependent receptor [Larkinella knui]|uniref:TonB-dependent receptor n=2 Tax=Larkinella knui TaxID=2025310 RepID=A0A3P1CQL3_9BACT|nr:TonB-dependent receptor [Larkinella knui]
MLARLKADVRITGTVKSLEGEVIPGVNVIIKGTTNGTVTDKEGQFALNVPENATLVFSFIGYLTEEVNINSRTSLQITLKSDVKSLQEVLVVGYGKQSRETVTTSVTKLDTKVLENIPYANAASAMQGTLSGVRVQSTSGQPGAAPRVIVRGGTSINNPDGAAPLYIVDGIIRTNMNDISPDDIESLQVLKDAAATAIYGARGSNGVVILTTKGGKEGKTRITYGYDFTLSDVGKRLEMASAHDYIELGRLGIVATAQKIPAAINRLILPNGMGTGNDLTNNTGFTPQYLSDANRQKLNEGWQSMPDPVDPTKTIIYKETDYQDYLWQTGQSHNHNIGLSGGTDKATFNASLGYLTNQGIAITTGFNRLTFNLNGNLKVRDNISVFGRALYSNSVSKQVYNVGQVFWTSIAAPKTSKYTFEDGTLAPGLGRGLGNPTYHLNNRNDQNGSENLSLATGGHWDILPGLSFDPQVSLYRLTDESRTFQPSYQNGAGPANLNTTRSATVTNSKWFQTQADAVLTYIKSFGSAHNLEAKAGFSYFGRKLSTFSASGQGAATDLIPTLNASATYPLVSSTISDQVILGYFGRINYDYKQRYLLTVNARYDGASNLGASNKWGFFPGVALGWNMHQEEFWKGVPTVLSRLKLRASYGVNGNISGLSDFQSQGEYGLSTTTGQQRYGGIPGIQQITLPNANLQWERSKTVDLGADLSLLNNRISLLFDVYRRVTDNLLTNLTLPQSTGFTTIFTNLASLENKGVEFEVSAQVLPSSSAFQWNIAFNASKTRNKILRLPDNGIANNRVGGIEVWDAKSGAYVWVPANAGLMEGSRLGDWYAYKALGVYATDEDAKSAPIDNVIGANKTKYGGDVIWQDTDGNGIIDQRDKVYVGNAFPVWTGGFSNTFSYKNLNLLIRMDYTTGHSTYNYGRAYQDGNWQGDVNMTKEFAEKSWKKQGDVTDVPRYYWQDQTQQNIWRGNGNTGISSSYVEKCDFLAIREVTLSYTIPSRFLQKAKLSNLRLNITGNNLHYFTGYKGLNPEDGGYSTNAGTWGDRGRYPNPRNLIFGASVSF